jgi:hypothetical protein
MEWGGIFTSPLLFPDHKKTLGWKVKLGLKRGEAAVPWPDQPSPAQPGNLFDLCLLCAGLIRTVLSMGVFCQCVGRGVSRPGEVPEAPPPDVTIKIKAPLWDTPEWPSSAPDALTGLWRTESQHKTTVLWKVLESPPTQSGIPCHMAAVQRSLSWSKCLSPVSSVKFKQPSGLCLHRLCKLGQWSDDSSLGRTSLASSVCLSFNIQIKLESSFSYCGEKNVLPEKKIISLAN